MEGDKKQQRYGWIDWAKTILIYLMMVCHAGLSGLPHKFIYAFHMPAFFIISGYLFHTYNSKKLIIKYIVPILFFSSIRLCDNLLMEYLRFGDIEFYKYLSDCVSPFYRSNLANSHSLFTGVWFIEGLLFCQLLLSIRLFFIHYKMVGILSLIFSSLQSFFIGDNDIQYYYFYRIPEILPFLCIGIYIKNIQNKIQNMEYKKWMIFIFAVFYIFMTLLNGEVDMYINKFGSNYLFFFFNACIASSLFFLLCSSIFTTYKFIEILSQGTLLILGTHMIYITKWNTIIGHYNIPINSQISAVIISFIVLVFSWYFTKILLKKSPQLLGK